MSDIQKKLISAGVANLKSFGYPNVTEENILTDRVYSAFFVEMLKDNKGVAGGDVDSEIDSLLSVVELAR